MAAIEFVATVVDGSIPIPESHREQFQGEVRVLVVANGDESLDSWPQRNRRRWNLIVKRATQTLSPCEVEELSSLEKELGERLQQVGEYPTKQFEELCAELARGPSH